MYCIEESICDIVGTLWRDSAPGELCPPFLPRHPPRGRGHFRYGVERAKGFLATWKGSAKYRVFPWKSFCGRPCFWLEFFHVCGVFTLCFGCFLPANRANKNIWIIEILINPFFAIFKISRPEIFETETRPETFGTETRKNGSRDSSQDRDQVSRLHHCWQDAAVVEIRWCAATTRNQAESCKGSERKWRGERYVNQTEPTSEFNLQCNYFVLVVRKQLTWRKLLT